MSIALIASIKEGDKMLEDKWRQITQLIRRYPNHHSSYYGQLSNEDVCLMKFHFKDYEKGTLWRIRRRVRYPFRGFLRNARITAICIFDHVDDDSGGFAYIVDGGSAFQHVEMEFLSKVGKGCEFTCVIFGRVSN